VIVQRLRAVALSASILLLSPALGQAQDARGFSILPSDGQASAGQKPPSEGDQRTSSREGPELWLRPSPIVAGGIKSVRVASGYQGRPVIWLRLTDAASEKVAAYTATHAGQRFAYVLDGQVVGQEVTISGPLEGNTIAISTEQDRAATLRLADQLSATIASGG
jgi:preprotein translocase subunit SecD